MTHPKRHEQKLIDYLREWRVARLGVSTTQGALTPIHTRKAAAEVVRLLGDLTPRSPKPFELQEIEAEIRRVWREQRSLTQIPPRLLRLAPWVFFLPHNQPDRWLAQDRHFIEAWLGWLRESGRPRTVVTLLRQFLSIYPQNLPSFETIRESLKYQVAAGRGPRIEKWRERAARFGLLERTAPELLTKHWWDVGVTFDVYGTGAGILPGLEFSGLVHRATEELLGSAEKKLGLANLSLDWLKRSLEWLESEEQKLRLSELRIPTAKALLTPFLDRQPDAAVQELLQNFLLRTIGDPRSQRPKWQGVPQDIRNVLLRWLVKASLDDFFRVLDETAQDSHWKYRKAFWSAYLRRGVIRDAWVVLGPKAADLVKKEFDSPGGAGKLPTTGSQSVLLMRIDTLTIAEWSHNGQCWIWRDGQKGAPKLYEAEYAADNLRGPSRSKAGTRHDGSLDGRWQASIAKVIADETGIQVARSDYMPRRGR